MDKSIPSIDSMLDDLHAAGWITCDPRLMAESSGDYSWGEEDLRSQWSQLQQRQAHAALVARPLSAG